MAPFLVYALPRSRTAWLSKFLSYRGVACGHEFFAFMRSIEEVVSFFARGDAGSAETAAAPGWRVLHHHIPSLNAVVIRRPVDEVVPAIIASAQGYATHDEARLRANMLRVERDLVAISGRPGTLMVDFADLAREDACAAIFEKCLGTPFDRGWYLGWRDFNVQQSMKLHFDYHIRNREAINGFKRVCKAELRRLVRDGSITKGSADGVD